MYEFDKNDEYAMKWFVENGFNYSIQKQCVSKTVFDVDKDGITDKFELHNGVTDIEKYMQFYEKIFVLKQELEKQASATKQQTEAHWVRSLVKMLYWLSTIKRKEVKIMSCCLNAGFGTVTLIHDGTGFEPCYITMLEFRTEDEVKAWQKWAANNLAINRQSSVSEMVNMEANIKYVLTTYKPHTRKETWSSLYTLDKYIKHLANENERYRKMVSNTENEIQMNREIIKTLCILA